MSKADVAAERKDQIVQATVECITKYGYHNFSMQDVARTAGVSKGIIHYYFLNKDDLMMSVLDKVAGDIEKTLSKEMQKSTNPKQKLEIFIDVSFDVVRNTKEYYQVNMDFWTQINQKEEVRNVIASHYAKFRESAAQIIREGVQAKAFRNIDPIETAVIILGMFDGMSLQWLFDEKVGDFERLKKSAKEVVFNYIEA